MPLSSIAEAAAWVRRHVDARKIRPGYFEVPEVESDGQKTDLAVPLDDESPSDIGPVECLPNETPRQMLNRFALEGIYYRSDGAVPRASAEWLIAHLISLVETGKGDVEEEQV